MNNINWKAWLPHLIAIGIFLLISLFYAQPVMQGKELISHDDTQFRGASHEAVTLREETGEEALWTNSMFSGMPTYLISFNPKNNWFNDISRKVLSFLPLPSKYLFTAMLAFYVMLLSFKMKPYASIVGALAFGMASYNVIIIGAGHYNKMVAISFFPLLIAGINLIFDKKYLWGAVLTGIAACVELGANHPQMTYYYFVFFLSFFLLYKFIDAVIKKDIKNGIISSVITGAMIVVGLLTFMNRYLPTNEYTPYSTRGKSELTQSDDQSDKTGGLDKSYIVGYSFGRDDIMSLLIPNYKGPNNGQLLNNPTAREITPRNQQNILENADQYWGGQDATGGAFYMSAIIFAFFILAFFLVKHPIRWVVLPAFVITLLLSWGKNYMGLTSFFIDHFPMYNKFRAVNSIIIVIEFVVPMMAAFLIATMLNEKDWMEKTWMGNIQNKKALLGGMGAIVLIVGLMYIAPTMFQSFFKPATYTPQFNAVMSEDQMLTKYLTEAGAQSQQINEFLSVIETGRQAIFKKDALRTLGYLIVAGLILAGWAFTKNDPRIFVGLLALVILVDVWSHDKRYLNDKNFKDATKGKGEFVQTIADKSILQDPGIGYRVLNLTVSPFNDGATSYYHHSIGGYHGAKIKRYQELIEHHIYPDINKLSSSKANTMHAFDSVLAQTRILNMLNTKYIILDPNSPALPNNNAYGNAWIVNNAIEVANADEELEKLGQTDLKNVLVYDQRYADQVKKYTPSGVKDSAAYIRLKNYSPNALTYEFNSSKQELVVFSEIFYPAWKVFVDGNPAENFRADYVLRAMVVPAGTHTIEFSFESAGVKKGATLSLIGSSILSFLLLLGIALEVKKYNNQKKA